MTEASESLGRLVVPGTVLGPVDALESGVGTYVEGGLVFASLVGRVHLAAGANGRRAASVAHFRRRPAPIPAVGQVVIGRVTRITAGIVNVDIHGVGGSVLPTPATGIIRVEDVFPSEVSQPYYWVGACVAARGSLARPPPCLFGHSSKPSELVFLPAPVGSFLQPFQVDHTAVSMPNCFRPGDVVKARIMSMGDARQYFLSTAEAELGVAWARCGAGAGTAGGGLAGGDVLLPIAWDEIASPTTGAKQARKAARPASGSGGGLSGGGGGSVGSGVAAPGEAGSEAGPSAKRPRP